MTLERSRVRVRAGYEFVSCRRHGDQRLPAGPIATAYSKILDCLWNVIRELLRGRAVSGGEVESVATKAVQDLWYTQLFPSNEPSIVLVITPFTAIMKDLVPTRYLI